MDEASESSSDVCVGERVSSEFDGDVAFYLGSVEGPRCRCSWEIDIFEKVARKLGDGDPVYLYKLKFTAQWRSHSSVGDQHSLVVSKSEIDSLEEKLVGERGLVADVFHDWWQRWSTDDDGGKGPFIQVVIENVPLRFRYI